MLKPKGTYDELCVRYVSDGLKSQNIYATLAHEHEHATPKNCCAVFVLMYDNNRFLVNAGLIFWEVDGHGL